MIDYKLLEALATVVECGGFERAGQALGLSQSAVSQRIRTLEIRLGQPVLVRSPALRATPAGQRLLNHVQQVQLLERDLTRAIPGLAEPAARLRIALNADSLATWWAAALGDFCRDEELLLDLVIEDQDIGLRRMREGDVAACLCSSPQPVAGARCVPLGSMEYLPLATPAYVARHFARGISETSLGAAPAIVFGPNDQLQHRFLAACGYHRSFPYHLCPSSEGFVKLALAGMGYGMIPGIQVDRDMAAGRLVSIAPGRSLEVSLYWHFWRHGGGVMDRLTQTLKAASPLTPPSASHS
ncbi:MULTISPECIES: LysR family transcriptional regulator ArgP [Marinobacter]|uniref:ArgP/LysG family DNA-binding transcriptional regulator n=1 Tax=Marinobacter profundi TaxID=2666256 RepID=A0A2G1UJY8_9GAMM|nr:MULTISPECIES: LysR family transcriptional regulator ArgP [Marinobacter]MBD3655479.1 LysR family transcriptional regulator ArgP [Marinobacter sp.]PHQ14803.1 ArgP/LysG family DNA-binding transcriptional regulator [Marinobacter profundi]